MTATDADGLAALETRVRRDLAMIDYPEPRWVRPRGEARDVVIVGAGQGGLVTAFALLRERVDNILVIDRAPQGREGPWLDYARMLTLRSPKATNGPDLGIPSLTYQAWHEARWGADDYAALAKIPTGNWAAYLAWYRAALRLPVENDAALERIEPADGFVVPALEQRPPPRDAQAGARHRHREQRTLVDAGDGRAPAAAVAGA